MPEQPRQEVFIRDPGLGTTPEAITTPLYMGVSEKGPVEQIQSFTNKADVIDTFGQGPLSEDLCRALDIAGGPVLGVRIDGSVAGTAGSVTKTAVAGGTGTGTVTVAGAPYDAYEVHVKITKTGTLGTAEFQYSLDDDVTDSEVFLVPGSGTFPIPDTNLTLTFVPGGGPVFFEAGDLHEFDCTAPFFSTVDLSDAVTAILADPTEFAFVVLTGDSATAAAAATLFAAVAVHATSLENQFRYTGWIMDGGSRENDRAAAITDHAASANSRVCLVYALCQVTSSKPIQGFGTPRRSGVTVVGSRAAASLVSTDLARFASGNLVGVESIQDDEFRSPLLGPQKFTTLRTWQGFPGFYIENANIKSPAGSDFVYWQHRRVMDLACDTTVKAQYPIISKGFRVNDDGTINETDARSAEADVRSALRGNLKDPTNAEGTPGHVSDFGYNIDRKNDVLGTSRVKSKVAIRPLAYAKVLETEIGFSRAV